jgi:hypothetical protein
MSKNSWHISSNSSEYGSEPFPNLSSEPDEGNGTWKDVRGGKRRTRTRKSRKTRRTRKSRKNRGKSRRR